ncbi:hypothetical protein [Virgisporangium aurantiacum]|uniref:Uncharacterized protein n=1 Tax=Virgisporangium aurantiacum TaxID=175570 RepID=A0A8J4E3V4_9ACTN|nr:hypothetical protein [Virgisporangium aurantiacum]GIJ60429.1 hypothetical protein Vau01_079450 [Virgisporangium aurantiacum]
MLEHEERLATVLRTVSDDVRTRPTLVADVRRGALRRRRRNRILGGAAVAVGAALVASAVAAGGLRSVAGPETGPENNVGTGGPSPSASTAPPVPVNCRVEKLPVPAGHPRSRVTGGDPGGRFLVGRAYASTGYTDRHPLLVWDGDRMTTVDMPGSDESFDDVNGSGVAVGFSFGTGDRTTAYVYRDGRLAVLRPPAGDVGAGVAATAVGEDGTIAGSIGDVGRYQPVVWRDAGAPAQPLPLPDGHLSGRVNDVDTDGTVLGTVSGPGSPGHEPGDRGYVWTPDGTGRLLPLPQIDGRPAQSLWVSTIHRGIVFGRAVTRDDKMMRSYPLLFDLRTERFTMLDHAFGLVGNSLGWMVQEGDRMAVAAPAGRAELPPLTPSAARAGEGVAAMSADGLVIGGHSNDANGEAQAVRWRCATRA